VQLIDQLDGATNLIRFHTQQLDLAVQLGTLEIAKVHYYLFKHFGLA